jgi:hypothetical protein
MRLLGIPSSQAAAGPLAVPALVPLAIRQPMMTAKCRSLLSACAVAASSVLLAAIPLSAQVAQPTGVQPEAERDDAARVDAEESDGRTGRRVLMVAGGTVLGAALGGGAGYAVAAVRCGRRDGCAPAAAYPYPRFGVIAGAVIGGGLTYGSTGFTSSRRRAAATAAGMLVANAWTWLTGPAGQRAVGFGARVQLPAPR